MKQHTWQLLTALMGLAALIAGCSQSSELTQSEPTAIKAPSTKDLATAVPEVATQDEIDQLLTDLQATPVRFVFPTPDPRTGPDWRPPPYDVPLALRPEDHFYFRRPIPSNNVNWPDPTYRYGSTFFGDLSIHTGVDIGADRGVPVLAAGPGEVVWTGFGLYRGIEDPDDPYGLAVSIRHDFGHAGKRLYTVYAHMDSVDVWLGQMVVAGEKIGTVGDTGQASGPHLHFEVRLGRNDFFGSRNPELWMAPPEGYSVLAGQITNTYGVPLTEQLIQIKNIETGQRWDVWTYLQTLANPDERYLENFVISDLPAGPYEIRVDYFGLKFITQLLLDPGRTNILNFRGWDGFEYESDIDSQNQLIPPY